MTARPTTLLSAAELSSTVGRLGREVADAYPDGVVLVAVLKGSVPFLADLVRAVDVEVTVGFLALSRFGEDTGRVRLVMDLDVPIAGRDVVVVEDLVDTGLTLTYLLTQLRTREPRSLDVCALLDKAARRIVPVPLRFVGHAIGDEFVLGYGFDWEGRYRNLPEVVVGDPAALRDDPGAHVGSLFPG